MKIQVILNCSITTLTPCNAFFAENFCPLNFAAKASSPSQTDQHIHKAPENILHVQGGWGEISLLYKPPEMQRFAWKNGFELLSSGPACLVRGPCAPSLRHKFSYHPKGNKLNSEKKPGRADGIVPSLAPAGRMGQPAPSLGFTGKSTWRDFPSQSVARSANKEPTVSSSWSKRCPGPASHPPGTSPPCPTSLGMLQHRAMRGSWSTLGIPKHTLPLWRCPPCLDDTAPLTRSAGQSCSCTLHT